MNRLGGTNSTSNNDYWRLASPVPGTPQIDRRLLIQGGHYLIDQPVFLDLSGVDLANLHLYLELNNIWFLTHVLHVWNIYQDWPNINSQSCSEIYHPILKHDNGKWTIYR